jgi:4-hydroxy-3-methylbut-2-enyl diphosphate reductase
VLYNVCKEKNEHTFFVSNPDQIEAGWFVPGDSVGICGATSTPMWLMEQVRERILTF